MQCNKAAPDVSTPTYEITRGFYKNKERTGKIQWRVTIMGARHMTSGY
jgi:hypothetical protein